MRIVYYFFCCCCLFYTSCKCFSLDVISTTFLALIKNAQVYLFNEHIAYRLIMLNITIFDIIAEIT